MNENENTTFKITYGMKHKSIYEGSLQQYSLPKTKKKPQINNLTLHLKGLEKEEQSKPKVNRRRDTIKIKEETKQKLKNQKERAMKLRAVSLKRSQNW